MNYTDVIEKAMNKGQIYYGPRGGKYSDPQKTIPYKEGMDKKPKAEKKPAEKERGSSVDQAKSLAKKVGKELGISIYVYGAGKSGDLFEMTMGIPKSERGDRFGEGLGTKAMKQMAAFADSKNLTIAMEPDVAFGKNKKEQLAFLKRHGFVPNKGKNKRFETRATFVRTAN